MNNPLRSVATPLSLTTFLGCGITGLMLVFGIRNHALGEVHEWLGIVFIIALLLHLIRNGYGVKNMLSTPLAKGVALVSAVAVIAYVMTAAPFQSGHRPGQGYGHGPGYAQGPRDGQGFHGGRGLAQGPITDMPIARMAPALGLDAQTAVARLKKGGVPVDGPEDSLNHLIKVHGQAMPKMMALLFQADPA